MQRSRRGSNGVGGEEALPRLQWRSLAEALAAARALLHHPPVRAETNHDRKKQLEEELKNMTKCMFNVTRGEYLHKEILFYNARHFGTNGL